MKQQILETALKKALPREPTKAMVLAGETALEDCKDTDFESTEDGSSYSYTTIRSDAPAQMWRAMVKAWEEENGH